MLFIKNIPLSPVPWRINDERRGIIVDQLDRKVAVIPKAGETSFEQRSANLGLIVCAPELLAALREAAYHLDAAGIPLNDAYYDLINRASAGVPPLRPRKNTVDK